MRPEDREVFVGGMLISISDSVRDSKQTPGEAFLNGMFTACTIAKERPQAIDPLLAGLEFLSRFAEGRGPLEPFERTIVEMMDLMLEAMGTM